MMFDAQRQHIKRSLTGMFAVSMLAFSCAHGDTVQEQVATEDKQNSQPQQQPPSDYEKIAGIFERRSEVSAEMSAEEPEGGEEQVRRDTLTGYAQVPPGSYTRRGSLDEPIISVHRHDHNPPEVHEVTVKRPFELKKTEVTQGEWEALMGPVNPTYFDACGDNCPLDGANWYEVIVYLNRLSESHELEPCYEMEDCSGSAGVRADGYRNFNCSTVRFEGMTCEGYRLPSEAEWEWAAQAKSHARVDDIAVYSGNSDVSYQDARACRGRTEDDPPMCGPHPVGTKQPNRYGLYDMIGNLWEWTNDRGLTSNQYIIKGAGWGSPARSCRTTNRSQAYATSHSWHVGFRPARTLLKGNRRSHKESAKDPN